MLGELFMVKGGIFEWGAGSNVNFYVIGGEDFLRNMVYSVFSIVDWEILHKHYFRILMKWR